MKKLQDKHKFGSRDTYASTLDVIKYVKGMIKDLCREIRKQLMK